MNGLKVPQKTHIRDMAASLVMSLVSIPDGLANGLLAGVNPLYGLFSFIALVQASGVSSSVPNPDGEYPDPSKTADSLRLICQKTFPADRS